MTDKRCEKVRLPQREVTPNGKVTELFLDEEIIESSVGFSQPCNGSRYFIDIQDSQAVLPTWQVTYDIAHTGAVDMGDVKVVFAKPVTVIISLETSGGIAEEIEEEICVTVASVEKNEEENAIAQYNSCEGEYGYPYSYSPGNYPVIEDEDGPLTDPVEALRAAGVEIQYPPVEGEEEFGPRLIESPKGLMYAVAKHYNTPAK